MHLNIYISCYTFLGMRKNVNGACEYILKILAGRRFLHIFRVSFENCLFSVAIAKGTGTLVCSRKFLAKSLLRDGEMLLAHKSAAQLILAVRAAAFKSAPSYASNFLSTSLKVSTSSDSVEARNCLCSQQRSCPVSFMGFVNKRIGLSSPKPPTKKLTICSIFLCCSAKCRCIALLRDFASRFGNNIELHSNQFVCSDCCDSIRYHHEAIGPNRTFYSARLPKINSTLRHADSGTLLTHFLRAFTAESILLASQFHPMNSILS